MTALEEKYLDPVFAKLGINVYSNEYIELARKDNEKRKASGRRVYNLCPQAGFQENVLRCDADILIIGGTRGGGKANPYDTNIITPSGTKKMGNIKIGDMISATDGSLQRVLNIYEQGVKDVYKVIFDDGATCECTLDHLWNVSFREKNNTTQNSRIKAHGPDWYVWTFSMIKDWLDKHTAEDMEKRSLNIPLSAPIPFERNSGDKRIVHPYLLGMTLAAARLDPKLNEIIIATDSPNFSRALGHLGYLHKVTHGSARVTQYAISPLWREKLERLGVLKNNTKNKYIPECYKYSSIDDRIELLQGMFDTCCGSMKGFGVVRFATTAHQLAKDVQWVVWSLGGKALLNTKVLSNRGKPKNVYELLVRLPRHINPFFTGQKAKKFAQSKQPIAFMRKIVGYEYVGQKQCRCIAVSNPNSLYVAGDFVVTHNTFIGLMAAVKYINNPQFTCYGFRRYEDDIKRGLWESSKHVFLGVAEPIASTLEWKFPSGAKFRMEHLQNEREIQQRFRGAEQPFMLVEELPEYTENNMNLIFTLIGSNRNTLGFQNKFIATCNPVGKSNQLRHLLDWYIDPDTDTVIPERSGVVRYFYRCGKEIADIAWGNSKEEVYENHIAKKKIDAICAKTGENPYSLISSFCFIEGGYKENKILQISDRQYMSKLMSQGGSTSEKDVLGVWRDTEESGNELISANDMIRVFDNTEQRDGFMRASADVALTGDFFVIFAFDGRHICDMDAWRGMPTKDVIPFIQGFLKRNGVREENFTYDSNGLGLWLKDFFPNSPDFNNKSQSSDQRMWNNLKSECAEKFARSVREGKWSIESSLLDMQFTDRKGKPFTLRARLLSERKAIRRKIIDNGRFEIISKHEMRNEIGHSPDFIEGWFMVEHLIVNKPKTKRIGADLL